MLNPARLGIIEDPDPQFYSMAVCSTCGYSARYIGREICSESFNEKCVTLHEPGQNLPERLTLGLLVMGRWVCGVCLRGRLIGG